MPFLAPAPTVPPCTHSGHRRPGPHSLLDDGSQSMCLPCLTVLLVNADEAGSRITVMVTAGAGRDGQ